MKWYSKTSVYRASRGKAKMHGKSNCTVYQIRVITYNYIHTIDYLYSGERNNTWWMESTINRSTVNRGFTVVSDCSSFVELLTTVAYCLPFNVTGSRLQWLSYSCSIRVFTVCRTSCSVSLTVYDKRIAIMEIIVVLLSHFVPLVVLKY